MVIGGSDTMCTFLWSVQSKHETSKNMDITFGHIMIMNICNYILYLSTWSEAL